MESGDFKMVPTTGLEPVRCYSLEPESSASANSATWANLNHNGNNDPVASSSSAHSIKQVVINASAQFVDNLHESIVSPPLAPFHLLLVERLVWEVKICSTVQEEI